jgi:L-methionine (R)-S-oxide reductase
MSSTLIDTLKTTTDASERLALIIQHFECDSGAIHMLGEDGMLHLKASGPGMPEIVLEKIRVIPVGKGMAGLCVERNAPVDSCNIQTDTTGDVQAGAKPTGLQGSIVIPIRATSDDSTPAIGALGIATMKERTFTEDEIKELLQYAIILAQ